MELGVCSWGLAGVFSNLHSVDNSRIRSRVERGGIWRRLENAVGWECRVPNDSFADSVQLPSLAESMSRRRRMLIVTNASKRRRWDEEPLVKGSVTRRALHIIKTLRSLGHLQLHKIDAVLQKWVTITQPKRKDWLNVLKEFDNKVERPLYFKVPHSFWV